MGDLPQPALNSRDNTRRGRATTARTVYSREINYHVRTRTTINKTNITNQQHLTCLVEVPTRHPPCRFKAVNWCTTVIGILFRPGRAADACRYKQTAAPSDKSGVQQLSCSPSHGSIACVIGRQARPSTIQKAQKHRQSTINRAPAPTKHH